MVEIFHLIMPRFIIYQASIESKESLEWQPLIADFVVPSTCDESPDPSVVDSDWKDESIEQRMYLSAPL